MIDAADGLPRADDIDSDRLRLSPLRPRDLEELFPVVNDEQLHRFTGGRPDTIDELRARLEAWARERSPDGRQAWLNWVVRDAADGRVVGTTQATVERVRDGLEAVVAWTIGSVEQGRGFGSEAARAMAAWLLAHGGVSSIAAHIHPEHAASAGVARNAGLTPTDRIVEDEVVWRLEGQLAAEER